MVAHFCSFVRAAAACTLLAPAVFAGDWYVDAAYTHCATSTGSASRPFCTIGPAIAAASAGDTIHVASGTYDGPLFVDRSLTFIGTQGAAATFLSGVSSGSILDVAAGLTVDVEGFTFQDGNAGGPSGANIGAGATVTFADCVFRRNENTDSFGRGGAIGAYQATVVLQRCTLENNGCTVEGGAIGVSGGALTLVDCWLHDNALGNSNLYGVSGGAIRAVYGATVDLERTRFDANGPSLNRGSSGGYGGAVSSYQSTVTAIACTFSDNTAGGGTGGALDGAGFTVVACVFERNHAFEGGAIDAETSTCDRSRFSDNFAVGIDDHGGRGGMGGAIATQGGVSLADCTFEGNVAQGIGSIGPGGGGAVYAYGTANAPTTILRCRLAGNRAEGCALYGGGGGGLLVGSHVALVDCEIVGNDAASNGVDAGVGGGVSTYATIGLSFTRCTIAGNRADNSNGTAGAGGLGGGISVSGACDLDHCVVAGNFAQASNTQDVAGTIDSLGWNDVGDTNGATFTGPGTGDLLDVDPQFADAANGDYRLAATSPCIDSGDATLHPAGRDVAWNPRILDGDLDRVLVVDRGAHEFSNVALAVSGSATPGGTLTFDSSGRAGLPVLLIAGASTAELDVRRFGALFVDLGAPFLIVPFGSVPNTQNATIPPTLPVPLTVYLQEAAIATGAGNFGNLVTLEIE